MESPTAIRSSDENKTPDELTFLVSPLVLTPEDVRRISQLRRNSKRSFFLRSVIPELQM
jgi:hypothetical protein